MTERHSSQVQKAKQRLTKLLASEPGFVGAGLSADQSGQYEIVVLVAEAASAVVSKVPSQWEGIPVRTEISGIPKKH